MCSRLSALATAACLAGMMGADRLTAQTPVTGDVASRIEITLERKNSDAWQVVDPATIFDRDDHVRFRLHTNFDGYLYVLNHSTSGKDELLYPRSDSGSENRILTGQEYQVPETAASFRIAGPAGQEVVYWILSPVELPGYDAARAAQPAPKRQPLLIPRCDDGILQARGECLDSSAGARGISNTSNLPKSLPSARGSSDMIFMREDKKSVIASASPLRGPVVYEFRISHR